ncbi:hypothetical protein T07_13959 [Trichinella nelsoni]|uniref:Uncharacterized protein n=1 Tax=Trichinella nelsoni TaxID=6336 RepID=A0A0V0S8G2_9BILA|nr:hypothetical protein T07_13959 [Trichinella nelsoni]
MEASHDHLNMHLRALGLLDPDLGNIRQVSTQVLIELFESRASDLKYVLSFLQEVNTQRSRNTHSHKSGERPFPRQTIPSATSVIVVKTKQMFRCLICEDLHRVQRLSTSERWKTAKQYEAFFWFASPSPVSAAPHFSISGESYYVILSLPDSVAPDVDDLLEPVGDIPLRNVEEPHSGTLRRIGRRPLQPTYDSSCRRRYENFPAISRNAPEL